VANLEDWGGFSRGNTVGGYSRRMSVDIPEEGGGYSRRLGVAFQEERLGDVVVAIPEELVWLFQNAGAAIVNKNDVHL